jgi:hypothetical protein
MGINVMTNMPAFAFQLGVNGFEQKGKANQIQVFHDQPNSAKKSQN